MYYRKRRQSRLSALTDSIDLAIAQPAASANHELQPGQNSPQVGEQQNTEAASTAPVVDVQKILEPFEICEGEEGLVAKAQPAANESDDGPRFREGDTLLTMKQVTNLTGTSDKFIFDKIANGLFPKPIKLGRSSKFILREVYAYINACANARN
ncbi:helix-turn-helix transcriptional regulator [Dryocola sp. LX212]